jgi:hypothetical protein
MDRLNNEMIESLESLHVDKIIIPEVVKNDLKTGTKEIGELIRKEKPDLIITLDRSGTLLWNNYSLLMLARDNVDLPLVITAEIGREISDRVLEEMGTNEEELFADPVLQKKYFVFLSEDNETKIQVDKLAEKIRKMNPVNVKSVMCVDDTRNQGMTLTFSAPWIISEAFKKAGFVDENFNTESLIEDGKLTDGYNIQNYGQPSVNLGEAKLFRQIISKNQWLGQIKNASVSNESLQSLAKQKNVILPVIDRNIYELMKNTGELGSKLKSSLQKTVSE